MNEIYKGMDNAAEQINENFQSGSIVDSGQNEFGSYVKYGDGTMETYQKVQAMHGTNVRLPQEFANSDYVPMVITSDNQVTVGYNLNTITTSSILLRMYRGSNTVSEPIEIRISTIGRWK